MTPTPGPPYEWDEDKRQQNSKLHGIDFTLGTPRTLGRRHTPAQ